MFSSPLSTISSSLQARALRVRSVVGASLGNLVEWYDWYTYSALTLYFAAAFFPTHDRTVQLMNAAAVFAVGFLMRPVGSWLFGVYADRRGRMAGLTLAVSLMCVGSMMIALAPTYRQIGAWASGWLVLARMLQGLSIGGEYGTSATYLAEIGSRSSRGFTSSFQYMTLVGGQLLSLGILTLLRSFLLDDRQLESWGWRIPFAVGAVAAALVFRLRRTLPEPEVYTRSRAQAGEDSPIRELLRFPRAIGIVMGLTVGGTVAFYTFTTYTPKFLVNSAGLGREQATVVVAVALLIFMLVQPPLAAVSDRIGRKPLLLVFGVLGSALTVPLLSALATAKGSLQAFIIVLVCLLIMSGYTSINTVVKAELFPATTRALGVGLPYAVTVSLFGGTAEFIALALKSGGHERYFFYYVASCIGVSLLATLCMKDHATYMDVEQSVPERRGEGATAQPTASQSVPTRVVSTRVGSPK